jgi:hypothetical protein
MSTLIIYFIKKIKVMKKIRSLYANLEPIPDERSYPRHQVFESHQIEILVTSLLLFLSRPRYLA